MKTFEIGDLVYYTENGVPEKNWVYAISAITVNKNVFDGSEVTRYSIVLHSTNQPLTGGLKIGYSCGSYQAHSLALVVRPGHKLTTIFK